MNRPRSKPVVGILFSKWSTIPAALALVLSFFLPPEGLGIQLCIFKAATGLPCPGCGLTRSLTCISHLHFADAVRFHPFGPLIYLLAVFLVVSLVVSPRRRARIMSWLARRERGARIVYLGLVSVFIAFGIARLIYAAIRPEALAYL